MDFHVSEKGIYCLKDHILCAVCRDGAVAFNVKDRMSYELNLTGARILHLLDGKRDIKDVIHDFAGLYEYPEDLVKEDVMDFLKNLMERGCIHVK
ncbi:MAG: PqqD family protein [bacterium]